MFKQLQYWLLLKISKVPKAFTYGAGALIAVILCIATIAIVLIVDETRIVNRHAEAMDTAHDLSTEISSLFSQLTLNNNTDCGSTHLIQLNALLLHSRFIREIGILDAQGRLVCTSTIGQLPVPIFGGYPSITTLKGRNVVTDVPLQVAQQKTKATIIGEGRFNLVISPHLTDTLYASADIVWLNTPEGLKPLNAGSMPADQLTQRRERAQAQDTSTWRLQDTGYELITKQAESIWVFQTQRDIRAIMHDNSILLSSMLLGTLLISLLAVGTLTPHVLRLRGIEHRVSFLCDDAHLLLTYQPIFDLKTKRLEGCEVLMRLKEGEHIWMPDQVIPTILQAGLARRLDHAVTRKAIRELCTQLPAQDSTFNIALNFFPESIDRATLIPILKDTLSNTPRNDILICLEVTEHSLSDHLITEVKGFKEAGFQIIIDDFGTGYSNLKSVMRLSPHVLKIDQSFVFELEDKTVRSTLIPEIVNIAQAVGAITVAEGIENADQATLLTAMGVRYGQGYALGRPMEIGPFLDFLDTTR